MSLRSLRYPSKHLLVLKTSSTSLQYNNFTSSKTSWRRLGRRKMLRWRRLEDMSWRCLEDMSWRRVLKTCLQDVLKTYLEDVLKTLWRETKYLLWISVSNKFQTCCDKERMRAPIERDRCLVIEIKIDDKNCSTLSEVSSDLRSQQQ